MILNEPVHLRTRYAKNALKLSEYIFDDVLLIRNKFTSTYYVYYRIQYITKYYCFKECNIYQFKYTGYGLPNENA